MKSNIRDALENRLSINSYLWPKNIDPFEFIEAVLKAGIKNIGLHTDFIEEYGVNKLKQELSLNKINVTSINSVGYFTDNFYFKQHEKIFNYAKILKPDVVCVISGGILGGPNQISSEYNFENKNLNIEKTRKHSLAKLVYLFDKAEELNITLGLEPIGSWDILKKGHFNSISSCLNLVKKNQHKLIIDLYHSFADTKLESFLKNSSKLGLLQFSNIKFDDNWRPIGRKILNKHNNINNVDISKYLKTVLNRKDRINVEFEIFQSDIKEADPKLVITNLKKEIFEML
jgi:hypothetical protein